MISFCGISSCANVQPPDGGPPDKTPPKILFAFPQHRSLNVKTNEVELEFNKFVNKQTVLQNLMISPAIQYSTSWSFSGKKLTINFEEQIPTNTTVSVILGTQYTDMQGNKPEKSFTVIFSTGDRLDSGVIQGTLDNAKPEGVFVFAYNLDGIKADTLNPSTTKPLYKTQIGASGTFDIQALAQGTYRIFVVRDEFKDGLVDRGMDAVGVASHDLVVREGSTATVTMRIGEVEDRTSPQIFEVQALAPNVVRAKFSEKIDTTCIVAHAFGMKDSATAKVLPVLSAHLSLENAAFVDIYLKDTLHQETSYSFTAEKVRDMAGNIIPDSSKTLYWNSGQIVLGNIDARLRSCSLTDSALNVPVLPAIRLLFSVPPDTSGLDSAFVMQAADQVPVVLRRRYLASNLVVVEPEKPLLGNSRYRCTFIGKELRTFDGQLFADTTFSVRFMTEDQRGYGGITGTLVDSSLGGERGNHQGGYVLQLDPKETSGKRSFRVHLSKPVSWEFSNIQPGAYRLSVYHDRNGNGTYDGGNPFPFIPAERFAVYAQEINIRARWTIENIQLMLPIQ